MRTWFGSARPAGGGGGGLLPPPLILIAPTCWFGLVWFGWVCSVLVLLGQGSVGYGLVRFMIDFVSLCLVGFARVRSILVGFTWSNLGRVG